MAALKNLMLTVVVLATHAVTSGASTPVTKVLEMLRKMKADGQAAIAQEKKIFADYTEWADDYATKLGFEIKTLNSDIEKLLAFIAQADDTVASLGEAIGALDAEIGGLEADVKAATAQRKSENEEYLAVSQDYSESVDALKRAISVLKQQAYDRPQAELLLQEMAKKSLGMRRVVAALGDEQARDDGAPAVAAYASQSQSLIQTLEGLLERFQGELSDVERAEVNAAHAYDLTALHLGNGIAQSKADREQKASAKASTSAESAAAKGQLAEARRDLADSKALLAETKATLAAKTAVFESNQKIRADEIVALGKAIDIISNPEVAEAYASHIKSLAQVPAPTFFQASSKTASARGAAKSRVGALLKARAAALHSSLLAKVAAEVVENPFAKVIGMIKELLAKLKEEAAAEAEHKAWCDDQLKKNKLKRDSKTIEVDRLTATVTELESQIQTMADTIATLAKEQAELTSAMSTATADRQKEHAENTATIADAAAASAAVKQALVILREFYSAQAGLLQEGHRQVPEMAAYKGQQGSTGGIIGMLEVIESDFVRLESETKAAEAQAASEYATFMTDSKASKKQKHEREFKLSLEKDQTEFEKGRVADDLDATQAELDAANAFYADLKPQCIEVHVSYEERVKRREEELAALRQAYEILDGVSVA